MRRRHTRKTDPDLRGPTIQRAVRLPEVQVQAVLGAIEGGITEIHSVTDAITDALWLWLYENGRVNGHPSITAPAAEVIERVEREEEVEPTEPTEPDRAYNGTKERPKFSDVDLSVISGD